MAKRRTPQRSSRRTSSTSSTRRSTRDQGLNFSDLTKSGNYKKILRNVQSNTATRYVLGGIAGAALLRFAVRYFREHPEISNYVRDNIDTVESKFREYRENMSSDTDEARH